MFDDVMMLTIQLGADRDREQG